MQKKKIMLSLISLMLCALFVLGACSSDGKKEETKDEKDGTNVTSEFVDADGQDTPDNFDGEDINIVGFSSTIFS